MDASVHNTGRPGEPLREAFPLALAATGENLEIVALDGGERMTRRLEAMGLRPGTRLETLQNERPGGLVVRVGGTKLALGTGMVHRIRVVRSRHHG